MDKLRAALGLLEEAGKNPELVATTLPKALAMIDDALPKLTMRDADVPALLAQLDHTLMQLSAGRNALGDQLSKLRQQGAAVKAYGK